MSGELYPRPISPRERRWLDLLLPADRPGYETLRRMAADAVVIGAGRWGRGDILLGPENAEWSEDAATEPVAAYGEVDAAWEDDSFTIALTLHEGDDCGIVELQASRPDGGEIPEQATERNVWSFSRWSPGDPCPATGTVVREVAMDAAGMLRLVISPARRALWLHDAIGGRNTLIPITNFFNELMTVKGIRDPKIPRDHSLLYAPGAMFADGEIRAAFARYNIAFRKVEQRRLEGVPPVEERSPSLAERLRGIFGGGER